MNTAKCFKTRIPANYAGAKTSGRGPVGVGVLWRDWVTALLKLCALVLCLGCCLDPVSAWSSSAPNIDSLGHCFQMLWIDAERIPASVIDHKAFRDWPFEDFMRDALRQPRDRVFSVRLAHSDSSVSFSIGLRQPEPASGIRLWNRQPHYAVFRGAIAHVRIIARRLA